MNLLLVWGQEAPFLAVAAVMPLILPALHQKQLIIAQWNRQWGGRKEWILPAPLLPLPSPQCTKSFKNLT